MGKKRKVQNETLSTKQQQDEEQELTLSSQKEINATVDMIIRTFSPESNNDNTECEDETDSDDETTDETLVETPITPPSEPSVPPTPPDKPVPPVIPPPFFGSDNIFLTCVDIFIFEFDDCVLEKILFCAILSMSFSTFLTQFKSNFFPLKILKMNKLENTLEEQISSVYNRFLLNIMTGIQTAQNKKDYLKTFFQSYQVQPEKRQNLIDLVVNNLQNIFESPAKSTSDAKNLFQDFELIIQNAAAAFLYQVFALRLAEFQKAVGIKIGCLENDLTFLSSEILRLTSANAGILQAANALTLVTQARFAEEKNFDEIFDAVEEIADVIEDLAEIYQDRLKVLRALFPFSVCPRPLILPETIE